MKNLLKYTYLLNVKKIEQNIENLWNRYQAILNSRKASWEDLNEARAILFFIGYLYPEKIVLESLEKRVKSIKPKINLDDFLSAVDKDDKKVSRKYKNNRNFNKLKEFYLIVKSIKNRVENNSYLDEERFNKAYSKLKPKNYF
jgi:hypothetical protein